MEIGMIGSGNVGRALAGSFTRAGHGVKISSRDPDHVRRAAEATGATGVGSNREAVAGAEVVVLAVPFQAEELIASELGRDLNGKIIIELANPLKPDLSGLVTEGGASTAERLQELIPRAKVVKAFNTVLASRQADPRVEGIELDGFVAADDAAAKNVVLDLVRSIGFRPVDAGPLAMSRALEWMALLNIAVNAKNKWSWQTGWKLLGPTA